MKLGWARRSQAQRALDSLFVTLLVRGGIKSGGKSAKLPLQTAARVIPMVLIFGLFGLIALVFTGQPVFIISAILHGMTFFSVGLLMAMSAGETLFNKEEADILLHRPISPSMLLFAKGRALLALALCMSLSMNFVVLMVGGASSDRPVLYAVIHLLTTLESGIFTVAFVVVSYQLCLRLVGREKLESVMTTVQVLVVVALTVGSQMMRFLFRAGDWLHINQASLGWIRFLPPAWFAALDDAAAGTRSAQSWMLAGVGLAVTALLVWLALSRLARVYQLGVQSLNEGPKAKPGQLTQARTLIALSNAPPLKWSLKNPASRAAFLLVSAYILRDRDVKLRLFPPIAQSLVYPLIILIAGFAGGQRNSGLNGFVVPFASMYLCITPLIGLSILGYSADYQAAEVFRCAPLSGPDPLVHGARVAFISMICVPAFAALAVIVLILRGPHDLPYLLTGVIALPIFVMLPSLSRHSAPLSNPPTGTRAGAGCVVMAVAMIADLAIAGLGAAAGYAGMFPEFLLGELLIAAGLYYLLRRRAVLASWGASE